jgi:branched-chain amino acid transport system ATP-binding protein
LGRQDGRAAVLVLDGVYAGYGTFEALHGVSMRVERNEVVALLGPNGAGKSTTLLTIAGVIKPTKGTIKFEGESIVGAMPEDNTRKGIALVPEGRRILVGLTVEENLR